MLRPASIAIVGYGISGIAAAVQLRRRGHRITHFERDAPTAPSGAGMLLHPPALRRLDELGVLGVALSCGTPVRRIRARNLDGRSLLDLGYEDLGAGLAGLGIQRATLHRLLAGVDAGFEHVHSSCEIATIDADRGVLTDESNESYGPFEIVLLADGANSLLRDQVKVVPTLNRRADTAALVGLLVDPNHVASEELVQYYEGRRHVSVWPVGRDVLSGHPKCAIAMSVPLADAEAFRANGHWRGLLARLCPAISALVTSDFGNDDLRIFAYRDVELRQYAYGRAALIGDAAHSMSPQLGMGALLALEDAAKLADALDKNDDCATALQVYSRGRSRELRQIQRASRWITPLFQSDHLLLATFRYNVLPNALRFPGVKHMAQALLT